MATIETLRPRLLDLADSLEAYDGDQVICATRIARSGLIGSKDRSGEFGSKGDLVQLHNNGEAAWSEREIAGRLLWQFGRLVRDIKPISGAEVAKRIRDEVQGSEPCSSETVIAQDLEPRFKATARQIRDKLKGELTPVVPGGGGKPHRFNRTDAERVCNEFFSRL